MSSSNQSALSPSGYAIVLTPPGPAAIAVVRLTGVGVNAFLSRHLSKNLPVGRPVHAELRDGDRVIDDPVVCRVSDAAVDLSLHGNAAIVRAVLRLAGEAGFVTADSGAELPAEAYDGDSLIEQEVAGALPLARTEHGWRTLLAQPAAWAALDRLPAKERSAEHRRMLAERTLQHLLSPPRVAIVGLPNAGKSTLANALIGVDQHITADRPGTTRDWIGSIVEIDELAIELVDTPGLRATADALEARAIELAEPVIAAADLVMLVLDAARPNDPAQAALVSWFPAALRVSNKCDLAEPLPTTIGVSASTGAGLAELRRAVVREFLIESTVVGRALIWTKGQRIRIEQNRPSTPTDAHNQ